MTVCSHIPTAMTLLILMIPSCATPRSLIWDLSKSRDVTAIHRQLQDFMPEAGDLGISRCDIPLNCKVTVRLPGGRHLSAFWYSATVLVRDGNIGSVIFYSMPQSAAEEYQQALRICRAFGGSATSRPVYSDVSIEQWCQKAAIAERALPGVPPHAKLSDLTAISFPVGHGRTMGGLVADGESIRLRWQPNILDYSKPCTLMLEIGWLPK